MLADIIAASAKGFTREGDGYMRQVKQGDKGEKLKPINRVPGSNTPEHDTHGADRGKSPGREQLNRPKPPMPALAETQQKLHDPSSPGWHSSCPAPILSHHRAKHKSTYLEAMMRRRRESAWCAWFAGEKSFPWNPARGICQMNRVAITGLSNYIFGIG